MTARREGHREISNGEEGGRHELSAISRQLSALRRAMSAVSMRLISSRSAVSLLCADPSRNLRSPASRRKYSTSLAEPIAVCRNLAKSRSVDLTQPSAMLAAMDAAARRIWEVKPNRSAEGKSAVAAYTANVTACAFSQTL